MSRIAILGATSNIAQDFVARASGAHTLSLYARRPEAIKGALPYDTFGKTPQDVVINFVGAGDPARIKDMGRTILDITQEFDDLALRFIEKNPVCRYMFLSSGVASGRDFLSETSMSPKDLTNVAALTPQDYYPAAKFMAEKRHRALGDKPVIDLRVFSYFSSTGDMSMRFFMTDVIRAIRDKTVFKTSPDVMVRDYLHPDDFHQLVEALIAAPPVNQAVECYSRASVDKMTVLKEMEKRFGLRYEVNEAKPDIVNSTGSKPYYYATSHEAAAFGYKPKYSSIEGLVKETSLLFPE